MSTMAKPWKGMGLLLLLAIGASSAFQMQMSIAKTKMNLLGGFLNFPFKEATAPVAPARPIFLDKPPAPFDPSSPDDLITRAKIVLASDLGVLDGGNLLDEDFIWIGASNNGDVLGKSEYLAAAKFFDMRTAFPDLDYKSHDYRLDALDPMTVRLTARTSGNMRGPLRLRNDVVQPNGKQMVCPPEAISITFGPTGTVKKICSGFTMDRLVGNTGGLCGVMAAATIAGLPPSPFEVYPLTAVFSRFLARPVRQLNDPKTYLAPFPESVMIQLAKGIVAAQMAYTDPDLLSNRFTFCGPFVGPIDKNEFLDVYAANIFGGAEPDMTHFRVDPYDPYRVWVDVRSYGQFEDGDIFETPPQAMSFTFDDDGFCVRITGDAVMDPSIGNTGGLGGVEGIKYAAGSPSPGIATRPLPQVFGRLRKRILEPFRGISVDEYVLEVQPPGTPVPASKNPLGSLFDNLPSLGNIGAPSQPVRPPTPQEQQAARKALAAKEAENARQARAEATLAANARREAARQQREAAEQKAKVAQQAAVTAATTVRSTVPKIAPRAVVPTLQNKVKESKATSKPTAEELAASKKQKELNLAIARKQKAVEEAAAKKQKEIEANAAKKQMEEEKLRVMAEKNQKIADLKQAQRDALAVKNQQQDERNRLQKEAKRQDEVKRKQEAEQKLAEQKRLVAEREDEAKRKQEAEQKRLVAKREDEAKRKQEAEQKRLLAKRQDEAKRNQEAEKKRLEAANANKRAEAEELARRAKDEAKTKLAVASKMKPSPPIIAPPQKAFAKSSQLQLSRTIALPKKKDDTSQPKVTSASSSKAPPKGVPSLSRWRKNRDGSITGLITGSSQFEENERITTSPIAKGDIATGNTVQTQSGSKYFLS